MFTVERCLSCLHRAFQLFLSALKLHGTFLVSFGGTADDMLPPSNSTVEAYVVLRLLVLFIFAGNGS